MAKRCRSCCSPGNPFTGRIVGCNGSSTGIGISTVQIKLGLTVLGTATTDVNGNYSGTSTSTLPSSVNIVVTPTDPAFAVTTTIASVTGTTTKTISNVTLALATGYHCGCCPVPWPNTLHTSGGFNLTWAATPANPSTVAPSGTPGWYGCLYSGSPYPFAVLNFSGSCRLAWNFFGHCDPTLTSCIIDSTPACSGAGLGAVATSGFTIQCSPLVITYTFADPIDGTNNWYCGLCRPAGGHPNPWGPTITITP